MLKITGTLALIATLFCSSPLLAQPQGFKSYFFDGESFREGTGSGAILVKDGRLPYVYGDGAAHEDPLPPGTGAVALFCYLQSSGGKLKSRSRVIPVAGGSVGVQGGTFSLAARTDGSGYLILALPPGGYDLKLSSFTKRVVVEAGKTTLASLRGGKRMVD